MTEDQPPEPEPELKFPRPSVLLLDMADGAGTDLSLSGHNLHCGTLGRPWRIQNKDAFHFVDPAAFEVPHYSEQEIVAVDLLPPGLGPQPDGEAPASEVDELWAKGTRGFVDPRPRAMRRLKSHSERILRHGGCFLLLVAPEWDGDYIACNRHQLRYRNMSTDSIGWTNWGLLDDLGRFFVTADEGREVRPTREAGQLGLARYLEQSTYTCVVEPYGELKERWVPLARNKFDADVAGAIAPVEDGHGWIFMLPRLPDQGSVLTHLVTDVLPRLAPGIFPDAKRAGWPTQAPYELPEVLVRRQQIVDVRTRADERILELETEIDTERAESKYLYDLLTEQHDSLVQAVIRALGTLGFEQVIDADKAAEEKGQERQRREDLQILDASPAVLVEVKGIAGRPSEEDSLQVTKYLMPRVREWKRPDIRGLSIINHQCNLPPLDRDNNGVFQPDVLTNAHDQGLTLLTTFDLYRLLRGFLDNGWPPERVKPLFYEDGRVEPVPTHYEYLGSVENFWEQAGAFGVTLNDDAPTVRVGDTLAYELPTTFLEEQTTSLQIDSKAVEQAGPGADLGVTSTFDKQQIRPRTRVFRVDSEKATPAN